MKPPPDDRMKLIREIKQHYAAHKKIIRSRLMDFKSVRRTNYFYELVYCLLTPQSSAAHAEQAVAQLRTAGLHFKKINPEPILRSKAYYIRFHRKKALYILEAKKQFPALALKVSESVPAFELREWLVKNVKGMGYKEATHFLRNIGKNNGLAILDRHILRTLKKLNVICDIPDSINKKQYLRMERLFAEFAADIGIVLDELDLVFWSMGTGEIRK
jgi:N-glycosylase/DNA lyase